MPAIQLARLKIQAAQLAASFYEPAAYLRGLRYLLNFYADRTHRPGQAGEIRALLPAYNVPAPVLRQVVNELAPLAEKDPTAGLALVDALWTEDNLECKLGAISLMGTLPLPAFDSVVERVQKWAIEAQDPLLVILMGQGLARLRKEAPGRIPSLLNAWLTSADRQEIQVGLRAATGLVDQEDFENIPLVFRLISPHVRAITPPLRLDLAGLLRALARRSPQETAHFLRQNLSYDSVPWLARQALPEMPPSVQEGLRQVLRLPNSPN